MEPNVPETALNVQLSGGIRGARNRVGLSQQELAELLAVSRRRVITWESGRGVPTEAQLREIARIGGVSIAWLYGEAAA